MVEGSCFSASGLYSRKLGAAEINLKLGSWTTEVQD